MSSRMITKQIQLSKLRSNNGSSSSNHHNADSEDHKEEIQTPLALGEVHDSHVQKRGQNEGDDGDGEATEYLLRKVLI